MAPRRMLASGSIALVVLACAGCSLQLRPVGQPAGPSGSAQGSRAAGASTGVGAPSVTDNEIPTPPGPTQDVPTLASPAAALRRFADTYINWNAADVRARLQCLAVDSIGQARSAMALAAAQTGSDPELRRAGISNRGTVEAISPLVGARERWVVVTLESTHATDSAAYAGLAPAWHLTLASVSRRSGGWVVDDWQPEN